MTVTYLFRSPGTGHSIEALFDGVQREMAQQTGIITTSFRLPHVSRGLRSVWQNIRFVARQRFAGLIHVTGDVHYVTLALPVQRTILTIHDCITLERHRSQPLRYVFFWLFWFYLPIRRAAVVTAVSEKTRQDLLRYVGPVAEKVVVVPNGYNPGFIYRSQPFYNERPVLLQLGTASHKNLAGLIQALEGIHCMLIIVGPLTPEIIVDLQRRNIAYESYMNVSREQIIELYNRCDIVTFISTYEGFGMPILEANASGRVVITSAISPMRELAAGAAHLVDPTDVAAIRQGILRLIHDDNYRQRLIDAGLQNAQQYTLSNAAAQYASLYQMLTQNDLLA